MAPLPALLLLTLLAPSLRATPIPQNAVAKAVEMNKCLRFNPFRSGGALGQNDSRAAAWNNACIDQRDACAGLNGDAEREKVPDGYCLQCSEKPATNCPPDSSCAPEKVCKAPPPSSKVALGPPSEGEGGFQAPPLKEAPPPAPACSATPGCIQRYVAGAYLNGQSWKSQIDLAWAAALGDRDKKDYSKCDSDRLRDTEHYLYHYSARLGSQVYNQFPLTFCGISYGYSFAKWTGVWGAAKKVFTDDDKPDSQPSTEEAYWGCRGLWDAYGPEQKIAIGPCR